MAGDKSSSPSSSSGSAAGATASTSTAGAGGLNEKQEMLLAMVKKKKACDKRAQEIVMQLIEPQVTQEYLLKNAIDISPPHFEDVVEERRLTGICGWTLCPNTLDPVMRGKKQKYAIRARRVLDISHRKAYCSAKCYARTTHFKKQLLISPLWMRDEERETASFEILNDETELHGLSVNITGLNLGDDDEKEKASSSSSEDEPVKDPSSIYD